MWVARQSFHLEGNSQQRSILISVFTYFLLLRLGWPPQFLWINGQKTGGPFIVHLTMSFINDSQRLFLNPINGPVRSSLFLFQKEIHVSISIPSLLLMFKKKKKNAEKSKMFPCLHADIYKPAIDSQMLLGDTRFLNQWGRTVYFSHSNSRCISFFILVP